MEATYALWLSLIVFLPTAGALLIGLFVPKDQPDVAKLVSFFCTAAVLALCIILAIPASEADANSPRFKIGQAGMQDVFNYPWIPTFNIYYFMGMDGISFPLVVLTAFIFFVSMWASWNIEKHVKAYCVLFLLLETGVLGVFFALDFFLFYVFWEVMLLPMYFLIGIWGGPRREYAAIKFFLYTLLGGALMLIAVLMLYFNSDLVDLARRHLNQPNTALSWQSLHLHPNVRAAVEAELQKPPREAHQVHTFNLLALMAIGQHTTQFTEPLFADWPGWGSIQIWAFLLLFIGFVIKVPAVPVHTWLPDAHVEAPTPISMILAGILLKLGGYGIIRICYPICPEAGFKLAWFVCIVGVVSMIYGAFAAMAQKDFKRLVAYSSVSHMGYVVLGLGVWSAAGWNAFNPGYWQLGMNGAMFQMIAHGFSSAGMFFLVGVVYDRVHHRNLDEFGGLFHKMPVYSGVSIGIFFAALGLPGLCGFIGEFFVTLSAWNFSRVLAVLSAGVVILTAGYILWTIQRVYLGPEYRGPHGEHLHDMTFREKCIAVPLLACAILFGVYPRAAFDYMSPSVNETVTQLTQWQERNTPKPAGIAQSDKEQPPKRAPGTAGD
jgi:NADH-quinone oxidoreductase subunit M